MIEHQRKRILRLTEENKNNRRRHQEDYNKLIDFITSFALSTAKTGSSSKSETSQCIHRCYGNHNDMAKKNISFYDNDYKDIEFLAKRVKLCKVLCSTFTRILKLTPQRNNGSNDIPTNYTQPPDENIEKADPIPLILIRGRKVHSRDIAKERFKQFNKRFGGTIEFNNITSVKNQTGSLLSGAREILISSLKVRLLRLAQNLSNFSQNRTINSVLCPSFRYDSILLKDAKNIGLARKEENQNTTILARMGR